MEKNKIGMAIIICLLCLPLFSILPQAQAYSLTTLKLTTPNPQKEGYFGYSVATNGVYNVVGAFGENSNAGKVYVFTASGKLVTTLTSPNPQKDGLFGVTVAINGMYIVVGASNETSGGYVNAGNAYVFTLFGKLVTTLTSPNPQALGAFGLSVATDGWNVVVGAPQETSGGHNAAGNAYVFTVFGKLVATLTSPNAQTSGFFGVSVAIDGGYIVVSAFLENSGSYVRAGNAYVFTVFGKLVATLISPNPVKYGEFGYSVATDGWNVVVGAQEETSGVYVWAGNAYVFTVFGKLLTTITTPNPQNSGFFGMSVATNGMYIIVGTAENSNGNSFAGRAYVFTASGNLVTTLTSPNSQKDGVFGSSVAINGICIVVGAAGEDSGVYSAAGNAYVFRQFCVA
jgi:hypothetical protein